MTTAGVDELVQEAALKISPTESSEQKRENDRTTIRFFLAKKKTQQRLQSKEALKLATNIIFISDNIKDKLKINPHKNSNFSGVKHVYQLSQQKIQLKVLRKSARSEEKLEKNISKNQIKSLKQKNEKSKMIFNQFYMIKSVILE